MVLEFILHKVGKQPLLFHITTVIAKVAEIKGKLVADYYFE